MRIETNQNIYDICLQNYGTLEVLFEEILIPNKLTLNSDLKTDQEINFNAFGKGNEDIKNSIKEDGLIYTNAIFTEAEYTTPQILDYDLYYGESTNSMITEIFIEGIAGMRTLIDTNKSLAFWGNILAKSASYSKSFEYFGLLKNQSGNVSIVEVIDIIEISQDIQASTWSISFTADNFNKAINFLVTGQTATNISWRSKFYSILL